MATKCLIILMLLCITTTFGCFGPSCNRFIFARPCVQPMCMPRCTTLACFRKYLLLRPPPPPPPFVIRTIQRSCCTLSDFSCCRAFYGKK